MVALVATCLIAPLLFEATAHAYPSPGRTVQVDVAPDGAQPQCPGTPILPCSTDWVNAISADGRYVAFESYADNLVRGDTNQALDIFRRDMKTGKTVRVSVGDDGSQAVGVNASGGPITALSGWPSISADGRYVAFSSYAPNLVPGDTNLAADAFVRDVKKARTIRVSVASGGRQVGTYAGVHAPTIAAGGRHVAFWSSESGFVPDDTNETTDVFVHDIRTKKTVRASVAHDGSECLEACWGSHHLAGTPISGDGSVVAFQSTGGNLVPDDTNQTSDIFVRDLDKKKTIRVSVATDGSQGRPVEALDAIGSQSQGYTDYPSISNDGRYVTFQTAYPNLIPNDSNFVAPLAFPGKDIFVHDLKTRRTERVSVSPYGEEAYETHDSGTRMKGFSFWHPLINGSGRYVSFWGTADNLVTPPKGDKYGTQYSFVYDRRDGDVDLMSVAPDGSATSDRNGPISANGRYAVFNSSRPAGDSDYLNVAYRRDMGGDAATVSADSGDASRVSLNGHPSLARTGFTMVRDTADEAGTPLTEQGANLTAMTISHRPQLRDLFVRLQLRAMPLASETRALNSTRLIYGAEILSRGTRYEVRVARVGKATIHDPSAASFGLFRCGGSFCTHVAELRGGYGTTGAEVVVSLPLRTLGLDDGGNLDRVTGFTATGSYATGRLAIVDRVRS